MAICNSYVSLLKGTTASLPWTSLGPPKWPRSLAQRITSPPTAHRWSNLGITRGKTNDSGGLKANTNEGSWTFKNWQSMAKHTIQQTCCSQRESLGPPCRTQCYETQWSCLCLKRGMPSKQTTNDKYPLQLILANRPKLPKTVPTMFHQLRSSTIALRRPNPTQNWTTDENAIQ